MYTLVNILPHILTDAEKYIMDNDRELYKPFFAATEKFCIDNEILFGGRVGIDLLMNKELTRDSFYWELYSEDPYNNAKRLTQVLYKVKSPHVNPDYVGLRTDLRNREVTILINTRQLIKVYALEKYRGIKLRDLMGPVPRKGYFTGENVNCVPEEVQLIEIYRTLYSPAKTGKWKEYIGVEQKLFSIIEGDLAEKATKMVGGAQAPAINRPHVDKILLDSIIKSSTNVLIGDYACNALGDKLSHSPRIQFITMDQIDELAQKVEKAISREMPNLIKFGYKLTFVKYSLNIPTDFQITKHSLYINFGKEQTPIADVYNSSVFELIPFWPGEDKYKSVNIGNPWVLLRFRFVDLWILKLISNIGSENARFLKAKIVSLLDSLKYLRQIVQKYIDAEPVRLFQLDNYVGDYINEVVAKKKLIKDVGERFPIYYPAKDA